MSLSVLGVLGRGALATYRTRFHSFVVHHAKKKVYKRSRQLQDAVDFQTQKQILVDFIKKGSLEGLDHMKENAVSAGHALDRVSFDAKFLETCSELGAYSLGRDYFKKLYSEGRAGIAVIGRYFSICHTHRDYCDDDERSFLLMIYDDLLKKYGTLDTRTCESLAKGIILTDRWKLELRRLLQMASENDSTLSPTFIATAVCGALYQRDTDAAWEFMELFLRYDKAVPPETYEQILTYGNQLSRLLRWMEVNGVILFKNSAEVFVRLARTLGASAKYTRVPQDGLCQTCRRPLNPAILSDEEFNRLQAAFLDPVLIGRDVFQKTRPEELKEYLTFLDKVLPVDVVLDALNIAYTTRQGSQGSKLVCSVTSHFAAKASKILVVGRQHMKKWPVKDLQFIYDRADVFLAEDLSEDDPFLLYATMRSGLGTKFVSRDRMSSHRFLLKRPDLRRFFSKWQALHQYHPLHISLDGSQVALREPSTFAREPQNTSLGLWHLPVVDHSQTHVEGHLQDQNAPWLCVRVQTRQ